MFRAGRESRDPAARHPPRPSLHSKCVGRCSVAAHRTARLPAVRCTARFTLVRTYVRAVSPALVNFARTTCDVWAGGEAGAAPRRAASAKTICPRKCAMHATAITLAGLDSPPLFAWEASKVTNRPDADYRNIPSAGPFAHYRGTGDILRIQTARPDDALRQELLLCVGFENVAQFGFSGILPLSFLRQCSDKAISLGTLRRFGSRPSSRDDGGSALSGNLTPSPWPRPEPRPAPAGPRCCHSPAPGCRACS